ncbi:hypothetical protein EXIGLDRAFT_816237 [Exidia glandulosa HHB12029]|uniref:Uncharacterized protein n=1 Tax=Exidia glandulosa HHB12029 TaxID=1314781 RepID=A0A165PQX7_EXIGL|nr:hypothetical protein EXIGLDRAFT_816237 [Exidia glandulosa HHB12029]
MPPTHTRPLSPKVTHPHSNSKSRFAWTPCANISDILTLRYMRTQDARLVRYEKYQLRYELLDERVRTFSPNLFMSMRPDCRDLVQLINAQFSHVARLWAMLIDTIAESDQGTLSSPDVEGYYCSSKMDVYLCDAIDTLYELDTECAHSFPDYDSFFGDDVTGCHCPLCSPSAESRMRLKEYAAEFHGDLDRFFFCKVFRDLGVETRTGTSESHY